MEQPPNPSTIDHSTIRSVEARAIRFESPAARGQRSWPSVAEGHARGVNIKTAEEMSERLAVSIFIASFLAGLPRGGGKSAGVSA